MRMQWHLAKEKPCREKNKENSEYLFEYVRHVNISMTNVHCTVVCPADIIKKTGKNQIWQNETEKQLHITE